MFFALESPSPAARKECIDWLDEALSQNQLQAHVLIDLAFDNRVLNTPAWRGLPRHSLYANTALAKLEHIGLWLVQLPDHASARAECIDALMHKAENKPMWSVVLSTVPHDVLGTQLAPCLQAETPDGLRWPVRWGDTRVLPHLLAALQPAEVNTWLAQVLTWAWFDRWGRWQDKRVTKAQDAEPPGMLTDRIWQLDEQRFAHLVGCGEVDQILSQIDDHRAHLLRPWSPTQAHDRVASALAVGHKHRLDAAPDCLALATLALSLDLHFLTHPSFTQALRATQQGQPFKGCLENLDASFWDQCALSPETI
ncbi:DUF4123 domain-containing protein [Aquabacterium sp.]|uniref:DUF4123 domain-containing protein n=1 Tax=Aquabacterium sp. TaxID=1872578 RepID=UPI0025C1598F|nr:DUF4123 domain-containing protein [Aquabacterium sp.]